MCGCVCVFLCCAVNPASQLQKLQRGDPWTGPQPVLGQRRSVSHWQKRRWDHRASCPDMDSGTFLTLCCRYRFSSESEPSRVFGSALFDTWVAQQCSLGCSCHVRLYCGCCVYSHKHKVGWVYLMCYWVFHHLCMQAYKESVLEPMLQGTDKTPALISDYKEYHTDTTVKFVVRLSEEKLAQAEAVGLHKVFKLQSSLTCNSMVTDNDVSALKRGCCIMANIIAVATSRCCSTTWAV